MAEQRTREQIIELIRQMQQNTVDNGCTPAEAAKFAAKVSKWVEEYQINEAEVRATQTGPADNEIEVCEHLIHTGKKVFNPGVTQLLNGLARGMCCQLILKHERGQAVYSIIGEVLDATYVCQISMTLLPALQISARLEAAEHGYDGGMLVRWTNQYLTGAGAEIHRRLAEERKDRAKAKESSSTALIVVTGETLAIEKREAAEDVLNRLYPKRRATTSRMGYDHTARERGREAGSRVGLHVGVGGETMGRLK